MDFNVGGRLQGGEQPVSLEPGLDEDHYHQDAVDDLDDQVVDDIGDTNKCLLQRRRQEQSSWFQDVG